MSDAKPDGAAAADAKPQKSGGGLTRVLILFAGAIVLFVAGLAGTLGMRGKLTAEYLGPLLGKAAAKPEGETAEAGDGAEKAGEPHGETPDLKKHAPPPTHSEPAPTGQVFGSVALPSPFSSEETAALFQELQQKREELRDKIAAADRTQKDLDLVRLDLSRRWDELNHREEQIEERVKSLIAERSELDSRSVVMKEAELSNLQKLAGDIEKMPAEAAAKILEQSPPERVAQILTFVKPREAGKILAALTPAFASQVSEKSLSIVKPATAAGSEDQ